MNTKIKRFLTIVFALLLVVASATTAFAHSGRTDSSGGHRDNKNKSGLGSYHYHCGGYPAHLHSGGYCPYRDVFPSSVKSQRERPLWVSERQHQSKDRSIRATPAIPILLGAAATLLLFPCRTA